jgi:hypothetical protein
MQKYEKNAANTQYAVKTGAGARCKYRDRRDDDGAVPVPFT